MKTLKFLFLAAIMPIFFACNSQNNAKNDNKGSDDAISITDTIEVVDTVATEEKVVE